MSSLTAAEKINLYKTMLLIRRTEERLKDIFAQGLIPGFIHLSIGQEGVAAGVCLNLRKDDYILSTHRGHGHALAKGIELKSLMTELFGKTGGCCGGRSGSMHLADREVGIMGSNGIVGGGIPIAVGVAFACKYKGSYQVTVCFFGEGATSEGAFHEALNLASLWNLPVLFCCEANGWAEFTPFEVHLKPKNVAERAAAYGIEAKIIDGDNVIEVYNTARGLVEKIRQGGGPILLECKTHRWEGHFAGDPQRYRSPEELQEIKKYCPLERLKNDLLESEKVSNQELKKIEESVAEQIDRAVKYAMDRSLPRDDELFRYVYSGLFEGGEKQ